MGQNVLLAGETVRTFHAAHMTTAILGNYHSDNDTFDIWILTPGNTDVKEAGGTAEWVAPPVFQSASAKEFVPGGDPGTVNRGTLFVQRGVPDLEAELLAFYQPAP